VASSTTGLTSHLLFNEIGTSDEYEPEADYGEASGSTRVGDGKIDGGDGKIDGGDGKIDGGDGKIDGGDGGIDGGKRTYPPPKRFSASEMEAMMMDVDTAQVSSTQSVSSSKRKFSDLHNDMSGISLLSSEPTAASDVSTPERAGKKRSTGKDTGRQPRKTSARKATEISNTTVLHGMQGTMNRVAGIFEKSVTQPLDPQSAVRSEALHFLQTRHGEDNLSLDETTKMVQLFMKDSVVAETYVALVNDDLRRNWLAVMLKE